MNGEAGAEESAVADDLIGHLVQTTPLSAGVAARVVAEVVHHFSEPVDSFVRRRHRELQEAGRANPEIFRQISAELAGRRFAAPELSERQLRRMVYG